MHWQQRVVMSVVGMTLALAARAHAGDLRITLPKRSHITVVQRLNREGVEAVRKRNYEKAERSFYQAYLLDPDDPFTLNNLGYVSELQGQVDRAQTFYALAAKQPTDAVIDVASSKHVEGRSMTEALAIPDGTLKVNHENVEAVRLLSRGLAAEADQLLQRTLKTDPKNVFTLNNLGVAKEMEGESQEALKYYDAAAASHSDAAAVVTINQSWRGKPAVKMAEQNAKALRTRLEKQQNNDVTLAELNFRGVAALNRNDLKAAEQNFRSAYNLDPNNAFALNNIGYLSELQGDQETAEYFYARARQVAGANTKVGLASRRSAEGLSLFQVAKDSDSKVEAAVSQEREALRRQHAPVGLRRRDNSLVEEPSTPPEPQQNQ